MSAVNFNNQEWAKSNFNDFIVPKYIAAPYTTIQNRAQLLDSSNMLQAVMGIERVPFRGINLLQKEFGPNGEQVWELESKDARIRCIGSSWISLSGASGNGIQSNAVNEVLEISFYGTGLNLVGYMSSGYDVRVTIDNQSEIATNIYVASISGVLVNRNYSMNQILNLVSGLTLGQHTVKLRTNASTPYFYGIEVLNQSSVVTHLVGQAFIGNKKESLAVLTTSAYNAGFSGTKGGRSCKYLLNGQVSQVVRECAATPSYLTNANHADEEVVRRINFREFSANRADDFSAGSNIARAFTLDDGTTTLVSDNALADAGVGLWTINNFMTLTIVGTGLDIYVGTGGTGTVNIYIDGTLFSSGSQLFLTQYSTVKICSGLSYGTHTIKIVLTNAGSSFRLTDFIIYQPKVPILPVGAIQIADYNVMANYVASTVSSYAGGIISAGIITKMNTRELTYIGAGVSLVGINANIESGVRIDLVSTNDTVQGTFFGSGFELSLQSSVTGVSGQLYIDGVLYTGAVTIAPTTSCTWTSGTSTVAWTAAIANTIQVLGLSLGEHTFKIVKSNATGSLLFDCFNIITPIHINHPTLKIGSLSLLDNAKINALALPVSGPDLSKAKAWIYFDQTAGKILASYNISQVLANGAGVSYIYFSKPFKTLGYAPVGSSAHYQTTTNIYGPHYCRVFVSDSGGVPANSTFALAVYGELQDE